MHRIAVRRRLVHFGLIVCSTSPRNPVVVASEDAVARLAPVLLRTTRPIYVIERGRPESEMKALGSGFFIRYFGRTMFVTASHVTDELAVGDLYVPTVGSVIESIPGRFYHTKAPAETPGDDRVDLAFIELPEEMAAKLPVDNVLTSADWDEKNRSGPNSHYLLCGWPAKRNQPSFRNHKSLPRAPISYRDLCLPTSEYGALGISPGTHYALHFDQKKALDASGRRIQPPELYGVSGSPLFFFHRYQSVLDPLTIPIPKLVGVAIECHKREKAVVVTRIAVLLGLLTRYFRGPVDPAQPNIVEVRTAT